MVQFWRQSCYKEMASRKINGLCKRLLTREKSLQWQIGKKWNTPRGQKNCNSSRFLQCQIWIYRAYTNMCSIFLPQSGQAFWEQKKRDVAKGMPKPWKGWKRGKALQFLKAKKCSELLREKNLPGERKNSLQQSGNKIITYYSRALKTCTKGCVKKLSNLLFVICYFFIILCG